MLVLLQGRVLRSWGPVHVITQILGLLAAVGGVTVAILAFGWKDVLGQKLYAPHKWAGVGVMGMAIVQVRVWLCGAVCCLCGGAWRDRRVTVYEVMPTSPT